MGKTGEARKYIEKSLSLMDKEDYRLRGLLSQLMGEMAAEEEDYAAAQAAYEETARWKRYQEPEWHLNFAVLGILRGDLLRRQGLYDEADEVYRQAEKIIRLNKNPYYGKIVKERLCLCGARKTEKGERMFVP